MSVYARTSIIEDTGLEINLIKKQRRWPKIHVIIIAVICIIVLIATLTVVIFLATHDPDNTIRKPVSDYYDASISPLVFYKMKDGASIQWYQNANTQQQLNEALNTPSHMITGDVTYKWQGLDRLFNHNTQEMMMGDLKTADRNLTLNAWLNDILSSTSHSPVLVFHTIEEATQSLQILSETRHNVQQPVFVQANIIQGPNAADTLPIDGDSFFMAVQQYFPFVTLSLGWTTEHGVDTYSWDDIVRMWSYCQNVSQPVTLSARASLLPAAWQHFKWLLHEDPQLTITVWAPTDSPANETNLDDLLTVRNDIEKKYVYYNMPEDVYAKFMRYSLLAGNPLNYFKVKQWDGIEITWHHLRNTSSPIQLGHTLQGKMMMLGIEVMMSEDDENVIVNIGWQNEIDDIHVTVSPEQNATSQSYIDDQPSYNNTEYNNTEPVKIQQTLLLTTFIKALNKTTKGIKLSFLTSSVLERALAILHQNEAMVNQPIWLHADVLPGPNSKSIPIHFETFVTLIDNLFPMATVSLGWTSEPPNESDDEHSAYTDQMVLDMTELAQQIKQPVNFMVHANMVVNSWGAINRLLSESRAYRLTVWARPTDVVQLGHLMFIRSQNENDRIYFDLPPHIMVKFNAEIKATE